MLIFGGDRAATAKPIHVPKSKYLEKRSVTFRHTYRKTKKRFSQIVSALEKLLGIREFR